MNDPTTQPDAEAPVEPSSGIMARAQQSAGHAMRTDSKAEEWVFSFRDQAADLLAGRVRDVDAYLFNAFRQIVSSKSLMEATRESLAGGLLLGATLGLEIGGPLGHYYLTPRYNSRIQRNECVPVIGYRGFFELGYRSGNVAAYEYVRVREGDHFESGADSERGNWWEWARMPGGSEDRPLTHVVAIAKLTNGQRSSLPMTIEEILKRRPTQWEKTPWGQAKFADAMATKTPFREQAKFLRLSTDLALAAEADERISWWNQNTQELETKYQDDPASVPADEDGAADGGPQREHITVVSKPVGNHLETRPSDLPEIAKAAGRDMTEVEYEAFTAWQIEQGGAL